MAVTAYYMDIKTFANLSFILDVLELQIKQEQRHARPEREMDQTDEVVSAGCVGVLRVLEN